MKNPVWSRALKRCADPQRARHQLDQLAATSAAEVTASAPAEQARILCALFSGSQFLGDWLIAHPELITILAPELLKHPRRPQGLRRELEECLAALPNPGAHPAAFERLRQFKQREMLRIGLRDL